MYELGSHVEMKKHHACTIKATGKKKRMIGKLHAWEQISKFVVQIAIMW